ncbi:MAG TPA: hypothetical protein VLX68_01830 [Chitinivibrionales bacterium]|nr:hypothetical protein [Chitinivibrionales bacterium]
MKLSTLLLSTTALCGTLLLVPHCGSGPTQSKQAIAITSPADGAKLLAGDTTPVQWTQSVANPVISYNYHLTSSTWQQFAVVIPVNSTEAKVVLPTLWPSDSFQIKVEDNAGAYNAGLSGYIHEKFIILTNALGGQTVHVGDSVTLAWRACPVQVSSVEVMLSTDNGKSYNEIIGAGSISISAALSYQWIVGSETGYDFSSSYPSSTCIVKVRQYSNDQYKDLSGVFTVAN